MSLRVNLGGKDKGETPVSVAKASLNRASGSAQAEPIVARIRHETG